MDVCPTPPSMEETLIQSAPVQEMTGVQQEQDVCEHWDVTPDRIVIKVGEEVHPIQDACKYWNVDSDGIVTPVGEDLQQVCNASEPEIIELLDTEAVIAGAEDAPQVCDAAELQELSDIENVTVEVEDPSEIDHPAGIGNSTTSSLEIPLPTTSTIRPIYSCRCMPTLTSQQMSLSFPDLQHPGTSRRYKCANCDHRFASEDLLVAHVAEGDGGNSNCLMYYRQWRQYREYYRKQNRVFLTKNNFPRFPSLGIRRNTKKVDDSNIQYLMERRHTLKRKSDDDDGILHHQTKRHT